MTSRHSRFFVTPIEAGNTFQRRYHYLDISPPAGVPQKATFLLLHGFPDCHASWSRITAPLSMSGFRLIVPDCLGCGLSSKPAYPDRIAEYGLKSMVEDLCDLLDHARAGEGALYGAETIRLAGSGKGGRIVVIGHDWGGALAWAFAQYHPERLLGVSSLAVPYSAPSGKYASIEEIIKRVPNFGYQQFFSSPRSTPIVEKHLERFLRLVFSAPGLFSSSTSHNDPHAPIANTEWVTVGKLERQLTGGGDPPTTGGKLLSDEEFEGRMCVFRSGGMEGPLNWYRTTKINAETEAGLISKGLPATLPALFLQPDMDAALPTWMAKSGAKLVPSLRTVAVRNCGHWVQLECPSTTELEIRRWFDEKVVKQAEALQGVVGWIKSKL
ncbi:alpha/beta-hydrolase [Tilletiaria anomala UBC 951]|uniref:Alpha/beta-hydrolase n=1 Tax=Tilletiaria anomala (strain ATCC 24038 / CBS 436.72 / UBC 951) TaxID=1037660 RepID=A0A066WN23_TILAU|nr:alpha/beta-hydrolase [Tilletiaria anomala UBC 951]KDN52369.1 alpha/beta-hydrolase [Tilletiaria anomala UBC 951]